MTRQGFHFNSRQDELSGLRCDSYRHPCGLELILAPKPGFVRKFAAFGIPFGSVMPNSLAGTAHYLEHCLFDQDEGGGLMGRLAALGCQANAYTSYKQTVYYFSATRGFEEGFFLYFDALLQAGFTDERVEAERGIIAAELDMYQDEAESFAYKSLMQQLYLVHGVKEDIGGSRESIAQITAQSLQENWRRYYSPAGMKIVLCGDFSPAALDELLLGLEKRLAAGSFTAPPNLAATEEPLAVGVRHLKLTRAVENASFLIGIKDPHPFATQPLRPEELALRGMAVSLYLESVLGEGSALYNQLYEEGVVNESFSAQYLCEDDFAFLILGGESRAPEQSAERVLGALRATIGQGEGARRIFEIQKKAAIGHYLRALDGVESLGMTLLQALMSGLEVAEYARIIDQAEIASAEKVLDFIGKDELCVCVTLSAKEN